MKTFKDLKVWERSHKLVLELYRVAKCFPKEERFGLTIQLRRSVSAVPTNIVEGFKRNSRKEFSRFINIAAASLEETKYQLLLSLDLSYIKRDKYYQYIGMCDEIGKMLYGLNKKVLSLNPEY